MDTTFAAKVCPRCSRAFEKMGGLSRWDNKTEICTECEQDEAMEDMFGQMTPMNVWPVERPWSNINDE